MVGGEDGARLVQLEAPEDATRHVGIPFGVCPGGGQVVRLEDEQAPPRLARRIQQRPPELQMPGLVQRLPVSEVGGAYGRALLARGGAVGSDQHEERHADKRSRRPPLRVGAGIMPFGPRAARVFGRAPPDRMGPPV